MKVTLIFPTGTDPRSPHLALPYLAAVLRGAGVHTELLDLDIDGLLALTRSDRLASAGEKLRRKLSAKELDERRLLRLSEVLPERAPEALQILRSPKRFYDPNELTAARETIFNCLELTSKASSEPVSYNIFPIAYDVAGVDPQSLADLLRVTANPANCLFSEYWESEVYPQLRTSSPDLVGITITNRQQIIPGLTLARELRRQGYFVVLGGTVYTKFVKQIQRQPAFFECFADGVVAYEGETAILELVDQLATHRDFSKVPNYLYCERGQVRFTFNHTEDPSRLPTPDFAGLPLAHYLAPEIVLPILFGKGCYFNRCKFCDIPYINHIAGKAYRLRPIELIVKDILALNSRFGCRHFEFTDEALAPQLLSHLADGLPPQRSKDLHFVGYARLERGFTARLCHKLADMGMRKLFFGLESGAQETLDHMDKGIQVADVPEILANCREAGIAFHIFSIVGFPEESEHSARKTLQFFLDNRELIDHPANSFDIHPFGLELRTRYFERGESYGILISPQALTKEFAIGVEDAHWHNTRGLTHAEVDRLVNDFNVLVRQAYKNYHASRNQLWPAFEEYAVLYASHYRNQSFRWRTSLPPLADSASYRVRWNPSLVIERDGPLMQVSSRSHRVEIPKRWFLSAVSAHGCKPIQLLQLFANGEASSSLSVYHILDNLIRESLIQIEREPSVEVERL
jgi:anaerobic magnesium-protoporphyrin IX monomethyl ester cyclase